MLTKAASKLALDGGFPAVTTALKPFNTIGNREAWAAFETTKKHPLSGYLAGKRTGGYQVNKLEEAWAAKAGARCAIAVNSATSGLLVACMAAGVGRDTIINCPSYTMSGTIAPAVILGARVNFLDVDPHTFCLPLAFPAYSDVTISVGLFGHEPYAEGRFIIQDNAQAFLARHGDAKISVYSLNVHKQIQTGEGGICVTNDDELAYRMQMYRNHGEVCSHNVGLNLRMTEVIAAIALAQLEKADWILSDRIAIAEEMTKMVPKVSWLFPPHADIGHSWYMWGLRVAKERDYFVKAMNAEGVPLKAGYTTPLHRLEAFSHFPHACPMTESLEDGWLVTYENCAYSPNKKQLNQFKKAFQKVCEQMERNQWK